MTTVAAIPAQLRRFASAVATEHDRLHGETRALAAALDRFVGRCREYPVPLAQGVSEAIFSHCRAIHQLVEWVQTTAERIEAADRDGVVCLFPGDPALPITSGIIGRLGSGLRLDQAARLALRVIWEVRMQISQRMTRRLHLPLPPRLPAGWPTLAGFMSRWWLTARWPALGRGSILQSTWVAQIGVITSFPFVPWRIDLVIRPAQQWLDQALSHAQTLPAPTMPSERDLLWLARLAPIVWSWQHGDYQATTALLIRLYQAERDERSETLIEAGAFMVGWHLRYQTLRWLGPWVELLPDRAQSWRMLNTSLTTTTSLLAASPGLPFTSAGWLPIVLAPQAGGLIGLITASRLEELIRHSDAWPALLEDGFWHESFRYIPLDELRRLVSNLEQINRNARFTLGLGPLVRPHSGAEAEPDGQANVTDVFPPLLCSSDPNQPYRIAPAALQATPHSLISPYYGEEVRAARIGEREYAVGINGLNLDNMAYAPNGLVSVIDTASGVEQIDRNAYYQVVRQRLLRLIDQLPPGSVLHLTGHSMGGGMCILLSNDPQFQQALARRSIQLASVTTLGAVRPQCDWDDVPRAVNGQPVIVRHYVDSDDALARAVGGGHYNPTYHERVHELNDHEIDQPTIAHSDYEWHSYTHLPEEVQTLPFVIDPVYFAMVQLEREPEHFEPDWSEIPPLSA